MSMAARAGACFLSLAFPLSIRSRLWRSRSEAAPPLVDLSEQGDSGIGAVSLYDGLWGCEAHCLQALCQRITKCHELLLGQWLEHFRQRSNWEFDEQPG